MCSGAPRDTFYKARLESTRRWLVATPVVEASQRGALIGEFSGEVALPYVTKERPFMQMRYARLPFASFLYFFSYSIRKNITLDYYAILIVRHSTDCIKENTSRYIMFF